MGINKDQVEGRVKEATGKVQEVAGKALDSDKLRVKGVANQVTGAVQGKVGDAKEAINDALKKSDQEADRDRQRE